MIIEAHYHLDERMQTVDNLLAEMNRHNIDRIALIATMCDPFPWADTAISLAGLLRSMLTTPLRGIGSQFYRNTVTDDGNFEFLGKPYRIYDTPDNALVARAIQGSPDRFYGWVFVNPRATDPFPEIEKWIGKPGWIGVKSHPFWHRYPVKLLDDVAAYCAEHGLPLLVHLGGDAERGDFRFLPDRHPSLKVVYAHAGVPFFYDVWDYAATQQNVLVDLSNPVYVNTGLRLKAIKKLGAAKCFFGTDGPYNVAHGMMIQEIIQLPLADADKQAILGGNLQNLISTNVHSSNGL